MICHYLSFNHGFKFWDYVRDGCHDFGNAVSTLAILLLSLLKELLLVVKISLRKNSMLNDGGYL